VVLVDDRLAKLSNVRESIVSDILHYGRYSFSRYCPSQQLTSAFKERYSLTSLERLSEQSIRLLEKFEFEKEEGSPFHIINAMLLLGFGEVSVEARI
jgi:hypothetical protein